MRQVQEVLRLLLVFGLSQRQASQACGIGRATVAEYLVRAKRAGVLGSAWETWSGEELEQRLYPAVRRPVPSERPEVDWLHVHNELKLKNVTLSLVWQEHREQHPAAYQYSRFCELYGAWRRRLDVCMRQVHRPGEKLFVDYCGATVPVVDAGTGAGRGRWERLSQGYYRRCEVRPASGPAAEPAGRASGGASTRHSSAPRSKRPSKSDAWVAGGVKGSEDERTAPGTYRTN